MNMEEKLGAVGPRPVDKADVTLGMKTDDKIVGMKYVLVTRYTILHDIAYLVD